VNDYTNPGDSKQLIELGFGKIAHENLVGGFTLEQLFAWLREYERNYEIPNELMKPYEVKIFTTHVGIINRRIWDVATTIRFETNFTDMLAKTIIWILTHE